MLSASLNFGNFAWCSGKHIKLPKVPFCKIPNSVSANWLIPGTIVLVCANKARKRLFRRQELVIDAATALLLSRAQHDGALGKTLVFDPLSLRQHPTPPCAQVKSILLSKHDKKSGPGHNLPTVLCLRRVKASKRPTNQQPAGAGGRTTAPGATCPTAVTREVPSALSATSQLPDKRSNLCPKIKLATLSLIRK